jgi:hypothetical protein
MSSLSTLPKGDSAWLLRKAIERIMEQVSVLETNIGSSTTGNSLNGQIIFNDNGTLRGDAGLTYTKSTTTLRAGLLIVPGNTQLATVGILYVGSIGTPKLKVDVGGTGITTITQADITGDLTVRTNKLFVNATGVGIGNNGPLSVLTVSSQVGARLSVRTTDTIFGTVVGGSGLDSLNDAGSGLVPFGCRGSTITLGSSAGIGFQIDASGNVTFQNVGGVAGTAMTLNSTGLGVKGTIGTASGDAVIAFGTRGIIVGNQASAIASGSFIDVTVVTTGGGYQGFLSVANTLDSNANTQIATVNGPTAGASFTVTTPSNGVIRITNTSGLAATISAQFFGGTSA